MENVERRIPTRGFNNYEVMPNLVSIVSFFLLFLSSLLFYNKCDPL